MLRLIYSNRLEALIARATEDLAAAKSTDPLAEVEVATSGRALGALFRFHVADQLGIATGWRFTSIEGALAYRLEQSGLEAADRSTLAQALLGAFADETVLADPALTPVRRYLQAGAGEDSRRFQLADELAGLFTDYDRCRPDVLRAWEKDESVPGLHAPRERWQRTLWRHLVRDRGLVSLVFGLGRAGKASHLPMTIVGPSYLERGLGESIARLADHTDVTIYALSPTREYWDDVQTVAEERRSPQAEPERVAAPLALRLWGRPCRDTARLLGDASGYDFDELYTAPGKATLLSRFQSDLLDLAEETSPAEAGDDSIRIHDCASVERELEVIATDIWDRLNGSAELRCSDITVYVAGNRDVALARIASVFHRMGQLPHHLASVSLTTESRLVEAFEALVELPLGSFTRPELLRLMIHPALIGRFPEAKPEVWVELSSALGIVRGADQGDNENTYIERDLFNWDQGAKRIALGSVASPSSPLDSIDLGGSVYRPLAAEPARLEQAAIFGLLSRSLIADANFARDRVCTLADWSEWFEGLAHSYLEARGAADKRALSRLLASIGDMARLDDGTPLSYKLAAATIRRQLAGLSGSRGELLADGVMVAPLELGFVVPADTVYIAGLGEGAVPANGRRSPLDARQATSSGDIEPAERIRVAFLEAILSARSAVRLSYVGRDAGSGEERAPSSLITELSLCLRRGYVDPDMIKERHPLRSWEAGDATSSPDPAIRRRARICSARETTRESHGPLPAETDFRAALADPRLAHVRASLLFAHTRRVGDAAPVADEPVEIPLSVLRRFLESPVQAWAGHVVGLSAADELGDVDRSDEPLAVDALTVSTLLRDVFVDGLRAGDDETGISRRLHERIRAEELGGSFPTGLFADHVEADLRELLSGWTSVVRGTPRVVSFGRARESAVVSALHPPIEVPLPQGRTAHLVGLTRPRIDDIGALIITPSKRVGAKHRVRGFFDHVVASAAELTGNAGYVVLGRMAKIQPATLVHLPRDRALDYLGGLAASLLTGRHDYALPCELALAPGLGSGEPFETQLRALSAGRKSTSDDFGPLGAGADLGPPANLLELVEKRFALLHELEAVA